MKRLRSVLARIAVLALGIAALSIPAAAPAQAAGGSATDWMSQGKFGVMEHYLAEGCAMCGGFDIGNVPSVDQWNARVNNYDVAGVVQQLQAVHAGWLQVAVGQNSGYYDSPNATFDSLVKPTGPAPAVGNCPALPNGHPSLLSQRDLIKELGLALHNAGIKLIVYITADPVINDSYARQMLAGGCDQPAQAAHAAPNSTYQANWLKVVQAWSQQWGTAVDGFWVDGAIYASTIQPYYDKMAAAMRSGNPNTLVSFNPFSGNDPGAPSSQSDFTAGETYSWPQTPSSRWVYNTDYTPNVPMQNNYLGMAQTSWGEVPTAPMTFPAQTLADYSRDITSVGADVTWDVGYDRGTGRLSDAAVAQLAVVAQAVGKAPGGPAYIDDADPAASYAGNWVTINPGGCAGGTCHDSQSAGNTATMTFTGTGITWRGITGPDQGSASVSIDNGPATTVNLYAPARSTLTPVFTVNGLGNGAHTLKITTLTSGWVTIDQLEVPPPSLSTAPGTIDDADDAVSYTGNWDKSNPGGCFVGTCHNSNAAGNTATINFAGTGITWYGIKGSDQGQADVYLDGVLQTTVNLYAPTRSVNTPVYTSSSLSAGSHLLRIVSKNSAWVTVDRYTVAGTSVDDSDPAITYTGSFFSYNPGGCFDGTCHNANTANSTAAYQFTGSGLTWYGITGPDQGSAAVSIDGGAPTIVNLYAPSRHVDVPVFTSQNLGFGPHTVTINTQNSGWVTVDAFAES